MRRSLPLLFLLPWVVPALAQPAAPSDSFPSVSGQALVHRALANELRAVENPSHLMHFRLRVTNSRRTTTKKIYETKDGDVARLLSIDGTPLSPDDERKEQARLDALLENPDSQRHRKQAEEADTARALGVLRALPHAFLYQYAGSAEGANGKIEKFAFRPNPDYNPPDLWMNVLTGMTGQIWVDARQQRVVRLEGQLQRNVNFGWGILGRLYKGGTILAEQAEVGEGQWRVVRLQIAMTGRILFEKKVFDLDEEESGFEPLPPNLGYKQAIQMLRVDP